MSTPASQMTSIHRLIGHPADSLQIYSGARLGQNGTGLCRPALLKEAYNLYGCLAAPVAFGNMLCGGW